MNIKKTVGYMADGTTRKSYTIHTDCGERFDAVAIKDSKKFMYSGRKYTIKALKEYIESLSGCEPVEDEGEPAETSTRDGADTWDCAHPCALLIVAMGSLKPVPMALETLGNYGWLDVMGRPDIARAEREINRVENLTKEKRDVHTDSE